MTAATSEPVDQPSAPTVDTKKPECCKSAGSAPPTKASTTSKPTHTAVTSAPVNSSTRTDAKAMPPPPPGYPRVALRLPQNAKSTAAPPQKRPVTTIVSSRPLRPVTTTSAPASTNTQSQSSQSASTTTNKYYEKPPVLLRRGKWTSEEEAYATRLIHLFKSGLLPLTDGTTLRNFLSKLLNCDPMRISKKFVGNNCIGKQVFRRRGVEMGRLGEGEMRRSSLELSELEQRFFDRVATTNRVKPHSHTAPIVTYSNNSHIRRNYIEDDRDRPPTPPWLKPPSSYVSKRKFPVSKKMRMTPVTGIASYHHHHHVSHPHPNLVPQQPRTTTVTIAKTDTEKDNISKSNSHSAIHRSESALEQLARTASAAKLVEDIVHGDSGLGDVEIKGAKLSSLSLQGSFQALLSLDMDSVENLAHLSSSNLSSFDLNKLAESYKKSSSNFKSSSRMESFIKSLSNANLKHDSSAAFSSLFSNLQKNSIHDFEDEKFLKQIESSTGLSKLRAHSGLNSSHHNSIEDFLSLMTSGDIPHEDANMLNVPLEKVMSTVGSLPSKLSQHQLLKLASRASLAKLASKNSVSESLSDLTAGCTSTDNGSLKKRKRGDVAASGDRGTK